MLQSNITFDNVIFEADNSVSLVESMFSAPFNLALDHAEIMARIHPAKKAVFDAITEHALASLEIVDRQGKTGRKFVNNNIKINVNNRAGGIASIDYCAISRTAAAPTFREFKMHGFDENAEPVVRLMDDRSLRLVFCSMPPRNPVLGARFDMDAFGEQLQHSVNAEIVWDDRDVFYIQSTIPSNVREISNFLSRFGKH
ncbi:hypothetical protein AAKU55_001787 [Oxalobacteraceae bacterium GrIS 1.11]